MQKGTQKLFVFLLACSAIGVSVENALADDGKISGFSEIYIVGTTAASRIPEIVKSFPEALAEVKDLTVVEVGNLVKDIKADKTYQKFSNQKIATWVEAGLDLVQAFAKFASTGKNEPAKIEGLGNVYAALQSIKNQGKTEVADGTKS